jgi:predicted MFS family arabinose efflux permease
VTQVNSIRALSPRTLAGLATLSAAAFVAVTTETLPTGLLPQIGAGFHVSQPQAGLLIGVYALVVAVGSVPLAVVTNRLPRKALILTTLAAYGASSIIVTLTSSFAVAVASRVVGGAAHAVFFAVASAYAARLVPSHLMGRAMALLQVGGSLALVAGVPLGTALGLAAGWRAAFLVLALTGLLLMALAARLLPPIPSTEPVSWTESLRGLRAPGLGLISLVTILAFAGHYASYTYIAHLLRRGGVAQSSISVVLLLFGLGGLVGVWLSGLVADRNPRLGLVVSFVALPVAQLVLWASAGFEPLTIAATIVWSAAFVSAPTLFMVSALRAGHRHPDIAGALINSTCNIGIATGSVTGGLMLASAGLRGIPPMAAVFFLATLVVIVVAGQAFEMPRRPVADSAGSLPPQVARTAVDIA